MCAFDSIFSVEERSDSRLLLHCAHSSVEAKQQLDGEPQKMILFNCNVPEIQVNYPHVTRWDVCKDS